MKHALVTGGAGLIGSHLADLLRRHGWKVRVLDNLEPQTHRRGRPAWVAEGSDFIQGDIRDRATITAALEGSMSIYQGAYAATCQRSQNTFTSQLRHGAKCGGDSGTQTADPEVIVASSQAFTAEGAALCRRIILFFRRCERLRNAERRLAGALPFCGVVTTSVPTPERAPIGGETVYGLTKVDQEKLVLLWGKQIGIPTVALRYSCTYGPRQSIFNPYTGVIAIFCTRLLNDLPPVLYEDGEQTRDFSFVEDIARANLLAAESDALDVAGQRRQRSRRSDSRNAEQISDASGFTCAGDER